MRFDSPRTLGIVLLGWGALGTLAIVGLGVLLCAPWFQDDTWQVPSLTSPFALFAMLGLAGAGTSLAAGVGLLRSTSWARALGYIASIASLTTVPLGTLVGIYGLIVLQTTRHPTE